MVIARGIDGVPPIDLHNISSGVNSGQGGKHGLQGPLPRAEGKVNACKTFDELTDLIEESGEDLTEDELVAVSGGAWNDSYDDGDDFDSDDFC